MIGRRPPKARYESARHGDDGYWMVSGGRGHLPAAWRLADWMALYRQRIRVRVATGWVTCRIIHVHEAERTTWDAMEETGIIARYRTP